MSKENRRDAEGVTVCLVENHLLAERTLFEKLGHESRFHILRQEDLPPDAAELKRVPVVFVIDQGTLPLPLSEYLRRLRMAFPQGKYIVLDKKVSEEELLRLLLLGIHGFLSYDEVSRGLAAAISRVFAGGTWVPEVVLQKYIDYSSKLIAAKRNPTLGLTRRESQVIELVRRRLSNKEIAEVLRVSDSTVKFHLTHIFAKLQVHDRHSLIELARRTPSTRANLHLKPSPVL